jgi:hypothetical protein
MRAASVFAAGLLAGCVTTSAYTPPTDGPRAAVRLVANGLGGQPTAIVREAPGCGDGKGRYVALPYQPQPPDVRPLYLANGAPAPAPGASVTVAANRAFTVLMQEQGLLDGWYEYGCARTATFLPQRDARYDVVFVSLDPYGCRIDVWRVEGAHYERVDGVEQPAQCRLRAYREK